MVVIAPCMHLKYCQVEWIVSNASTASTYPVLKGSDTTTRYKSSKNYSFLGIITIQRKLHCQTHLKLAGTNFKHLRRKSARRSSYQVSSRTQTHYNSWLSILQNSYFCWAGDCFQDDAMFAAVWKGGDGEIQRQVTLRRNLSFVSKSVRGLFSTWQESSQLITIYSFWKDPSCFGVPWSVLEGYQI